MLHLSVYEFLIMEVLGKGASYGYEVSTRVFEATEGALSFPVSTLYTTLRRLERKKFVRSWWGRELKGENPRGRYYRVTPRGRAVAWQARKDLMLFLATSRKLQTRSRIQNGEEESA